MDLTKEISARKMERSKVISEANLFETEKEKLQLMIASTLADLQALKAKEMM